MQSAGEIIVSVDHARTRAAELDLPFARELALYLAHGWLHLCGYDDRKDADREKMRAAEATLLDALDQLPQFPDFQLQ
jgi:probable rRNA maturation factor